MRRLTLVLLCAAAMLVGGCALLLESGVLYEETWSNPNTTAWVLGDTATAAKSIEGGRYHVLLKEKTTVRYLNTEAGPFGNTQVDLDVKHEAGADNLSAGGVLFRVAGSENMYLFQVSPIGSYQVGKWIGNVWKDLAAWTDSTAVNKGFAENHLTVIADGTSLTFLINSTEVKEITDTSLLAGYVGVAVTSYSDDVDVEESFDNLVVREL